MGLGAVELLMACEEEFEVRIPDEAASRCYTPRILSETILKRLKTKDSSVCPSQKGFYRVRKALINIVSVKRNEISPDTRLTYLVQNSVPQFWRNLEKELSVGNLPKLELGLGIKYLLYLFLPLISAVFLWVKGFEVSFIVLPLAIYAVLIANVGHRIGYELPITFQRVKDLIPLVGSLNDKTWTNEGVLNKVMLITAEQTGLNISKFTPDSHYIDDIGLD